MSSFPWVRVRVDAGEHVVDGAPSARLGTPVPHGGGGPADGVWAEWHWDGQQLVVRNDRYGYFPLFYAVSGTEVLVSQSPLQLIAEGASAEPDEQALGVFVLLGFFLTDETAFREIRALPPGAELSWSRSGWHLRSERPGLHARFSGSREQLLAEYRERFEASIAKRHPTGDHSVHMLSGGEDSSHILFELARQGALPSECVTVGFEPPEPGDEVDTARRLAERTGVPHRVVQPTKPPYGRYETDRNVLTHMASDEGWWFEPMVSYLSSGPVSCLYDGGGTGDVFSAGAFLTPENIDAYEHSQTERVTDLMITLFAGYRHSVEAFAGRDRRGRFNFEAARARIEAEVREHLGTPNPVSEFVFWNRTRREIGVLPYSYGTVDQVHTPFLDRDLVDLLRSVPVEMVADQTLHRDEIAFAYPEWGDFRRSGGGRLSRRSDRVKGELNLLRFGTLQGPRATRATTRWYAERAIGRFRGRGRQAMPHGRVYTLLLLDRIRTASDARQLLADASKRTPLPVGPPEGMRSRT